MNKLAIIVPYRDREENLKSFIPHMKYCMETPDFDYEIVVVEQLGNETFNKGKLMNIGFEWLKDKCTHFCFHDVDLIAINPNYSMNITSPTHISMFCSQFDYEMPYHECFGGVVMFTKDDFIKVNGYSNKYFGWGCEDDDMFARCVKQNLKISRKGGRYLSLHHKRLENTEWYGKNAKRLDDMRIYGQNYLTDGLNSLEYKNIDKQKKDGWTLIKANL